MRDMISWIEAARNQKASGVLLQAGSSPFACHLNHLSRLDESALSPAELASQLDGFLSPREKSALKETGVTHGFRKVGQGLGKFQVAQYKEDILISMQWRNPALEDLTKWEMPTLLMGQLMKEGGVSLVVGPQQSGKTAFLSRLAREFSKERKGLALYSAPEPELEHIPGVTRLPHGILKHNPSSLQGLRVLLLDGEDDGQFETAARYAERGVNVVLAVSGSDVFEVLERIHHSKGAGLSHRIFRSFQSGVALRLMPGLDNLPQTAMELVVASSAFRDQLMKGAFVEARSEVKAHAEKSGHRSLNQSILNLLLKRKVDLKTGFAMSLHPDELDEMLKKVGI